MDYPKCKNVHIRKDGIVKGRQRPIQAMEMDGMRSHIGPKKLLLGLISNSVFCMA